MPSSYHASEDIHEHSDIDEASVGSTPSQQHCLIETLRKEYSMRQICQTLGFNKSTFYYQPRIDASEDALRAEIQRLAVSGGVSDVWI